MNKIFAEFENENSLRTYPFASGCLCKDTEGIDIGNGVVIDAVLYPVNPSGVLYMSSVTDDGSVEISDDTGVIMSASLEHGSSVLEFYEVRGYGRHVGTLVGYSAESLATLTSPSRKRYFRRNATTFSASCVFPVVNDGVMSLNIGDTGMCSGDVKFINRDTDEVRVSTDGSTLRVDVVPYPIRTIPDSIQHIYCIVDGKTPFRIQKIPFDLVSGIGNTIAVYLDNIERQDICNNAHRENAIEMTDTCGCSSSPEDDDPVDIPETYQVEVVDVKNGAESAFYLASPNLSGYVNPISITLDDGIIIPKTEVKIDNPIKATGDSLGVLTDNITSKGVTIQIPGLAASI